MQIVSKEIYLTNDIFAEGFFGGNIYSATYRLYRQLIVIHTFSSCFIAYNSITKIIFPLVYTSSY